METVGVCSVMYCNVLICTDEIEVKIEVTNGIGDVRLSVQ